MTFHLPTSFSLSTGVSRRERTMTLGPSGCKGLFLGLPSSCTDEPSASGRSWLRVCSTKSSAFLCFASSASATFCGFGFDEWVRRSTKLVRVLSPRMTVFRRGSGIRWRDSCEKRLRIYHRVISTC